MLDIHPHALAGTLMAETAAKKDSLHGQGPVYRTLKAISELPLEDRLNAFVERLDLLELDELAQRSPNQTVRIKILAVGKEWLHDAEKSGAAPGKFAALRRFDSAPKKAAV